MNVRTSIRVSAIQELQAAFEDRLKLDEPLARYTSARVGGPAQLFLIVNSAAELETAVSIAYEKRIPLAGPVNILMDYRGSAMAAR